MDNSEMTESLQQIAEAIEKQTKAIEQQTKVNKLLAEHVETLAEKQTLADMTCDFTQWNIVEAISNLSVSINQLNKNK